MNQYIDLLQTIRSFGTQKPGARPGMPGSLSLFGHQFRHDLADGFPALTTKKLAWKFVVTELIWFLRGDTNIKYLVDNGCNIWNEDAYNYYLKKMDELSDESYRIPFTEFVGLIKKGDFRWKKDISDADYKLGNCGEQYGKLWRSWVGINDKGYSCIDQIAILIDGLKNHPESRRHIITAWNPATLDDMALNACHTMFQFNCRPMSVLERLKNYEKATNTSYVVQRHTSGKHDYTHEYLDRIGVSKYYLDCQLYQRSADVVLGVPFNIASYALLTHIIAKICDMAPGHFIHTFGDVHIYDNHQIAVDTQLNRVPAELSTLVMNRTPFDYLEASEDFDNFIMTLKPSDFILENYNPQPAIKAELSTGLIK